jgi:hypothetical protein
MHNGIEKTDHEQQVVSYHPLPVHTSTVRKSLAAKTFQCAFRKVDHDVRRLRSGEGSMPLRFSTLATVPRPIL